jgi:hypothetical protein
VLEGADGAKIKLSSPTTRFASSTARRLRRTRVGAHDLHRSRSRRQRRLRRAPVRRETRRLDGVPPVPREQVLRAASWHEVDKEWRRTFEKWSWGERVDTSKELVVQFNEFDSLIEFPLEELGASGKIKLVVYSKDFTKNSWGRLFGASDSAVRPADGDKYIPHYWEVDLKAKKGASLAQRKGRLTTDAGKLRIYQMFRACSATRTRHARRTETSRRTVSASSRTSTARR